MTLLMRKDVLSEAEVRALHGPPVPISTHRNRGVNGVAQLWMTPPACTRDSADSILYWRGRHGG
jgi:hypothetical protein